jgi:hypothetical protein
VYSISAPLLHVNVTYIVLYRNTAENIPLEKLQSQHHQMNLCYSGLNDTLSLVPQSGKYNFASVIGIPNIVFLPSQSANLNKIVRIPCTATDVFTTVSDLNVFAQKNGYTAQDGILNVYIGQFSAPAGQKFSVLGQTLVTGTNGGNIVGVDYRAVGGPEVPGIYGSYQQGMTLVHEVGHALGLFHIWSATKVQVYSDIPLQKNPNLKFQLINGDGYMDNCMIDCDHYKSSSAAYTPVSWLINNAADCSTVPNFEMGCNFMDYATDDNLAMFSQQQVLNMRDILISGVCNILAVAGDGQTVDAKPTANTNALRQRVQKSTTEIILSPAVIGCASGLAVCILVGCSWFYFKNSYILFATGILSTLLIVAIAVVFTTFSTDDMFYKDASISTSENPLKNTQVNGLRLSSVTATTASVTWQNIPKALLYVVNDKTISGNSATVTGLQPASRNTISVTPRFSEKIDNILFNIIAVLLGKAVTLTFVTLPEIPSSLTTSVLETRRMTCTWNDQGSLVKYNIYKNQTLIASDVTTNSFTFTDLLPGVTYSIGVSAATDGGESLQVVKQLTTIPLPVLNWTISSSLPNDVSFDFDAPDCTFFVFRTYLNDVRNPTIVQAINRRVAFSGLTPGTEYKCGITVQNIDGGESSMVSSLVTTYTYPDPPTNLQITNVVDSGGFLSGQFEFNPPDQTTAYIFEYKIMHGSSYIYSNQVNPGIVPTCSVGWSGIPNTTGVLTFYVKTVKILPLGGLVTSAFVSVDYP